RPEIAVQLGPSHAGSLVAAGRSQQGEPKQMAEGMLPGLRSPPESAQLVVRKHTISPGHNASGHPADYRGAELVAPRRMPVHNSPNVGQRQSGHSGAVLVLYHVQQLVDVRPLYVV